MSPVRGILLSVVCSVAALLLTLPAVAQPDPTSPVLEALRAEAETIRRETAVLGGADTMLGSLNNLREKLFQAEERDRRIDLAISVAQGTTAELEAYRQTEEARRIYTREDAYDDVFKSSAEYVIEGILVAAGHTTAAAIGGAITLIADVAPNVAKKIIKGSDLAEFRKLIDEHKLRIDDLYDLKIAVEVDRTAIAARIREVEARRARYSAKMDEIGRELDRLRAEEAASKEKAQQAFKLTELADLTRDTDSLDDAFQAVEAATGLPVERYYWHWSARNAAENKVYYCPPSSGVVSALIIDGTDRYHVSSGLCFSGVHAGVITLAGGFVRVRHYPVDPQHKLVASTRNGITSGAYGSGSTPTFSFVPVVQ